MSTPLLKSWEIKITFGSGDFPYRLSPARLYMGLGKLLLNTPGEPE